MLGFVHVPGKTFLFFFGCDSHSVNFKLSFLVSVIISWTLARMVFVSL